MALSVNSIQFLYSLYTAAAGCVQAGTAATSLGNFVSTTQIPDLLLDGVFDDVTGDENAADNADYRCIFVANVDPAIPMTNLAVYLSDSVGGGADLAIALDDIPQSVLTSSVPQAEVITNPDSEPGNVGNFISPVTRTTGLQIGTLLPGHCIAIWLRRMAAGDLAVFNDGVTVLAEWDDVS